MEGMLPGFDPPAAAPARARTRKEEDDDANKIQWRRYKGASIQCQDCVRDRANRTGIGPATWIRKLGTAEIALCYHHRAEYLHREALEAPRGG